MQGLSRNYFETVVAKDVDRKPRIVKALRVDGDRLVIFGEDESRNIGFPIDRVYVFDGGLVDEISRAFERNDLSVVDSLWGRATRYVIATT